MRTFPRKCRGGGQTGKEMQREEKRKEWISKRDSNGCVGEERLGSGCTGINDHV